MQQANIIYMNHNRSTALERSVKLTGGLKPVLRDPNLALSFYHGSKHTVKIRIKTKHLNLPLEPNFLCHLTLIGPVVSEEKMFK